jgi:hypothetical protein
MICPSVNLLRFMSVSFAGEQTNLIVRTFQGSRSTGVLVTAAQARLAVPGQNVLLGVMRD